MTLKQEENAFTEQIFVLLSTPWKMLYTSKGRLARWVTVTFIPTNYCPFYFRNSWLRSFMKCYIWQFFKKNWWYSIEAASSEIWANNWFAHIYSEVCSFLKKIFMKLHLQLFERAGNLDHRIKSRSYTLR